MGLIPIYNIFILLKITGKPGWWTIIFFIPLVDVNIIQENDFQSIYFSFFLSYRHWLI